MVNCHISAPKIFRRAEGITLINCNIPNAQETMWNCKDIVLKDVNATGDYFGLNAVNVDIDHFNLIGNYAFDGVEISLLETRRWTVKIRSGIVRMSQSMTPLLLENI